MTTARLGGWNVRKIPVVGRELVGDAITGATHDTIDAPDKAMTVRTDRGSTIAANISGTASGSGGRGAVGILDRLPPRLVVGQRTLNP